MQNFRLKVMHQSLIRDLKSSKVIGWLQVVYVEEFPTKIVTLIVYK